MKLLFFGTPDFAVPSLKALHNSPHDVQGIVTTPDTRSGRGLKLKTSSIKKYAEKLNIPIFQPNNLKDKNFISTIKEIKPDIYVVVAYKILPESILSIPVLGAVNLHASLLPKYRGAAPIYHAILNGEEYTGITTFIIQNKVDTGNILLQQKLGIKENATSGEIFEILSQMGAKLIIKTLDGLSDDTITPKEQNDKLASFAPKIKIDHCKINWNRTSEQIHNKIRAFSPIPGAFTYYKNKRVKLFRSKVLMNKLKQNLKPGQINFKNPVLQIGTTTNAIQISDIQIEGKARMPVTQFILGYPKIIGEYFE